MRTNSIVRRVSLAVGFLLSSLALAQSTAFTYQGKLNDAGQSANGLHDFRFRLFDAATGGNLIGLTQCVDNVSVTAGVFTATVDFGNQFATPAQRFIEVQVRRDTGLDCSDPSGFTILTTRQPITPAPLATHAKSAFSLDAADGSIANAVVVDNIGRVGIGTTTPSQTLTVRALQPSIALQDTAAASQQSGYISLRDSGNVERGWFGYGSAGDPDLSIVNARPNGDIVLNPFNGNVGVGTGSPTAKLQVNGEIRFGSSGQFRPPACEEPLRIIRGRVSAAGNLLLGNGFTVTHDSLGNYTVTFTTPFTGAPVVTASQEQPSSTGTSTGFVAVVNPTTNSVQLRLFTTGSLNDQNFNFIAIGPR